jgi:hypothetical protein
VWPFEVLLPLLLGELPSYMLLRVLPLDVLLRARLPLPNMLLLPRVLPRVLLEMAGVQ